MIKTVVVADAGNPFGSALKASFEKAGLDVFAGYESSEIFREGEKSFFYGSEDFYGSLDLIKSAAAKIAAPVDMLVVNTGYDTARDVLTEDGFTDTSAVLAAYRANTIAPLMLINGFLPLLERGKGKRICVVTLAASSINLCSGQYLTDMMSRAPLNMAMTQLYNHLRPSGYTFRMYCRNPSDAPDKWAVDYFLRNRRYEPHDLKHSDEERIVLRDWTGTEVPW
jgi:NAD(P)-dependent dehydrogenase (short-subunit alcohol dehydrogenase family)